MTIDKPASHQIVWAGEIGTGWNPAGGNNGTSLRRIAPQCFGGFLILWLCDNCFLFPVAPCPCCVMTEAAGAHLSLECFCRFTP